MEPSLMAKHVEDLNNWLLKRCPDHPTACTLVAAWISLTFVQPVKERMMSLEEAKSNLREFMDQLVASLDIAILGPEAMEETKP